METRNGNWKGKWKRNLLAIVVIQMLLVFVPRHPSALPASSFCQRCPQLQCNVLTWVMFMFSAAFYLWCSIFSKQLILHKYTPYMSWYLNQNTTPAFQHWQVLGEGGGKVLGMGLLYPRAWVWSHNLLHTIKTGSTCRSRNKAARVGMLALF